MLPRPNCSLAVLICIVSVLLNLPATQAEEPVKIGVLTDLTGRAAYWGIQTKLGAELALKDLREGGHEVSLIFEDHTLSSKGAVTAAHKLFYSDQVDAVYSDFAVTTIAASPIARKAQRLFLGVCAADSFVQSNPYAFKSYLDYSGGCKVVAQYWKSNGIKKVAVLRADTEYGELCFKGVREVYPESFVVDYSSGEQVRTQALLIKKSGAEAVLNASFEDDVKNMLNAFQTTSYHPFVAANFDALTERVAEQYQENEDRFLSFGFQGVSESFLKRIKVEDPSNTLVAVEGAALAYVHVHQLVKSIESCGTRDVLCQRDYLIEHAGNLEDIIGFQKFGQDRQAVFKLGLKKFVDGREHLLSGSSY